jgi:lipoprotein NlpI
LHLPYFNRGLAYRAQGNRDLAIADFRMALSIKPNYQKAQEELMQMGVKQLDEQ